MSQICDDGVCLIEGTMNEVCDGLCVCWREN